MDSEKLIEQANRFGMELKRDGGEFEYSIGEKFLDYATALSTLQAENEKLRAELERMKGIMRYNGIMVIPSKYPGGRSEWNIPKPRGQKED